MALDIVLADEAATIRFGEDMAMALKRGDYVALSGDLGAGKSTFSRAVIRAIADDAFLEVPSPTFTLVQSYATRVPVAHFDLYRLADADELDELGLEEALAAGALRSTGRSRRLPASGAPLPSAPSSTRPATGMRYAGT